MLCYQLTNEFPKLINNFGNSYTSTIIIINAYMLLLELYSN